MHLTLPVSARLWRPIPAWNSRATATSIILRSCGAGYPMMAGSIQGKREKELAARFRNIQPASTFSRRNQSKPRLSL